MMDISDWLYAKGSSTENNKEAAGLEPEGGGVLEVTLEGEDDVTIEG